MLWFAGVTPIETKVAEVTVRDVLPDTLPNVAVMLVGPSATEVARPVLSIVANSGFEELHVT